MLKIGLTGGIGSGKTTVAILFENLGVPVYYADDRAKEIMHDNISVKNKIIELFGEKAYVSNKLNIKYISGIVFDNSIVLKKLEKIVHPAVRQDFLDWAKKQNTDYVIVENAILYKSGMDKLVDFVIVVTADKEKKLERLKKRDKKSKKELEKIIQNQLNEKKFLKKSDFVIKNNGNKYELAEKVARIDKKLKKS